MIEASRLRRWWLLAGWLLLVAVVYFSLAPEAPTLEVEQGDKLQHLLGYGVLMLWFAQLYIARPQRWVTAAGLVAMGVALEFAQGWGGIREFSYADMAANAAGVMLGWLLAPPRTPNLLATATTLLSR